MKLLSTIILLSSALTLQAAGGFTITGKIPGLKPGTKVALVSKERGDRQNLAETTATDGAFTLSGTVASPSLCEIRIDSNDEESLEKAISLMVENLPMTVTAAHIDSVAPGFYTGTGGLMKERNVTVTGGQAQKEYAEYNEAMFPYDFDVKSTHFNLFWDENRDRSDEGTKKLTAAFKAAEQAEYKAIRNFTATHPTYSISGYLMLDDFSSPFNYTSAELDAIAETIKAMPDTARLNQLTRAMEFSRRFPRETAFTDVAALDTLGSERRLSDFAGKGKYVMVDFWASWCGPCRAAIPHVRDLYKKYGDKLEILAVSLDSAEKPWRKAMADEQMEWTQLWADKTRVSPITEAYQVHSIPFLMLLDPEGRIIHAGHNPEAINETLAKALGEN